MYVLARLIQAANQAETTASPKKQEVEVFGAMVKPITQLIDSAVTPALLLVGSIGAIYCIILGARLAKAEEPQDREKAKSSLKNALVGFLLIFVLLVALKVGAPLMTSWYQANS
ncbi:MAG: pilin [Eubacteriales bacterium]|nr:pilin [Eubacteriales bacterium]